MSAKENSQNVEDKELADLLDSKLKANNPFTLSWNIAGISQYHLFFYDAFVVFHICDFL